MIIHSFINLFLVVRDKLAEVCQSLITALQDHYYEVDNTNFEKKYLVYTPNSISKERTIYCILSRMSMELWNVPGKLACLLFSLMKAMFAIPAQAVNIVIDCSLVWIGSQHKNFISNVSYISKYFVCLILTLRIVIQYI
jgi:hypothetical protein